MLPKSLITIGFCSLMSANIALANDVVTWQDDNGVTHFGNAQFAPAGQGDEVRLQPANAMQVPDLAVLQTSQSSRGPAVMTLDRPVVQNPRGFRGYQRRAKSTSRRRR